MTKRFKKVRFYLKYMIIKEKNSKELRKLINSSKGKVIVEAGNEKLNNFLVANNKIDVIFNFEKFTNRDYFNMRQSGLNHVMCNALKKNGIAVGFDFGAVLNKEGFERSKLLGKMEQNVRFCKKYKVKMVFDNFGGSVDQVLLDAFSRVLSEN
ncbi:MAG: RNase P subunit p30 family protein [Nanoarchaeota archaeon]